jgi:hypothetical protein
MTALNGRCWASILIGDLWKDIMKSERKFKGFYTLQLNEIQ